MSSWQSFHIGRVMLIESYSCQNDDDDTFNLQASCIPHSNLDDETEMKRKERKKKTTHTKSMAQRRAIIIGYKFSDSNKCYSNKTQK